VEEEKAEKIETCKLKPFHCAGLHTAVCFAGSSPRRHWSGTSLRRAYFFNYRTELIFFSKTQLPLNTSRYFVTCHEVQLCGFNFFIFNNCVVERSICLPMIEIVKDACEIVKKKVAC